MKDIKIVLNGLKDVKRWTEIQSQPIWDYIDNAITLIQELADKVNKFEAKEFDKWEEALQPDYLDKDDAIKEYQAEIVELKNHITNINKKVENKNGN